MLAYSDTTRSEVIPDVPTVAEQGYKDFEVVFSYVLLVAPGTPQPIIDVLLKEAKAAVMSEDIRDKLKAVDTIPIALSPAESSAWLKKNEAKWRNVITQMNIVAE